jgi:hypothetical protein
MQLGLKSTAAFPANRDIQELFFQIKQLYTDLWKSNQISTKQQPRCKEVESVITEIFAWRQAQKPAPKLKPPKRVVRLYLTLLPRRFQSSTFNSQKPKKSKEIIGYETDDEAGEIAEDDTVMSNVVPDHLEDKIFDQVNPSTYSALLL